MNRVCGVCGRWITLLPGAVLAGHGMFFSITVEGLPQPAPPDDGFVGGVCNSCLRLAADTAAFFQRERLARGGA